MQDKQFSLEADIETIDEHGEKGKSKLTIYKDSKKKVGKKEQTIMITKKARHEAKHVNAHSSNFIQYLLEGFINNRIAEDDVKTNIEKQCSVFPCEVCKKTIKTKQGCSQHKTKVHPNKFICVECGEEKSTKEALDGHVELQHNKSLIKRTLSQTKEFQEHACTECKVILRSTDDLEKHKLKHSTSPPHKKSKINDNENTTG